MKPTGEGGPCKLCTHRPHTHACWGMCWGSLARAPTSGSSRVITACQCSAEQQRRATRGGCLLAPLWLWLLAPQWGVSVGWICRVPSLNLTPMIGMLLGKRKACRGQSLSASWEC